MSKLLRFCVLSVLISGLSFAGILNVTSPAAGSEWCINDSNDKLEIRWHETPHDHQAVKIRLFDSSGNIRIMSIIDNTINDGSFNWLIPASVQPGQYTILVKTLDNQESDFSAPITIKNCTETQPFVPVGKLEGKIMILPKPDLEIKIIPIPASPSIYQKTLVEFRVKNVGSGSSKATKMRVFMGMTNTDTWNVKPLDPGRFMYKTKEITPDGAGYILWDARVDEDNKIGDNKRNNNYAKFKMNIKGPDLKITHVSTPDYKKTVGQKCIMNVTVTNVGHADSGRFEIDCDMDTCPLIAQGRKFRVHSGLAPGKSATFQFTHRYACFKMVGVDFYVDKNNQVKEENENNNKCGLPFHISGENIGKKKSPWSSNCN